MFADRQETLGGDAPNQQRRRLLAGTALAALLGPAAAGAAPSPTASGRRCSTPGKRGDAMRAIDAFTAASLDRFRDSPERSDREYFLAERREVEAGEELARAIRVAAGMEGLWAPARFEDDRPGGRTWVALPPGMVTRADPGEFHGCTLPPLSLEMKAEGLEWTSIVVDVLAWDLGEEIRIDPRQLDVDGPSVGFVIGRDGIARTA